MIAIKEGFGRRRADSHAERSSSNGLDNLSTRGAANRARAVAERIRSGQLQPNDYTEAELFLAMKTSAERAAESTGGASIKRRWTDRWQTIRDYLVTRNLGLAYSIVGKFRTRYLDHDDLRSEALHALVRSVDGFDALRGFRFSTYACHAITRALIQASRKAQRRRETFPIEDDDVSTEHEPTQPADAIRLDRIKRMLASNQCELTDREAVVLDWRFPQDGGERRTLEQIGQTIGLSKERVRQLQQSALAKLRDVLEADPILQ